MKKKSIVLAIWLSIAASVSAFAQSAPSPEGAGAKEAMASRPSVEVRLVQKKVVNGDNGVERLVDAQSARPDDILEYQATYTNRSDKDVSRVVADLPLPEGLAYVPRSARPADGVAMATRDRQFGAEPLERRSATGKSEAVPYDEYRDVRWTIDRIPAGKSVTVTARARVEAVAPKGIRATGSGEEARTPAATRP